MFLYNFQDVQNQFLEFMIQNGIVPYNQNLNIAIDNKIHRFRTQEDAPGKKSGAYRIFDGACPAGWVQDWRKGPPITWCFRSADLRDVSAYKMAVQDSFKHQEEVREDEKAKQTEASDLARIQFQQAKPAPQNHPYLLKKNVPVLGLHFMNDALVVPMRDAEGRFVTLQWIYPNGGKKFFPGAPKKGAFYSVALDCINPQLPILIAEGYATMATIHELTGYPCVAAMDCGNLYPVAEALKAKYPDNKIIFMADNDFRTNGNPGITHAMEANRKLNLNGVIAPEFNPDDDGSDWNDFTRIYGEDKAKLILQKKIRYCCLSKSRQELSLRVEEINAQVLRKTVFPPVKWAVEGFLPSGCTILAGSPKVGKSILALHLAVGVAIGGIVLSKIQVEKGEVLYLALEDNLRRLQERINGSDLIDDNTELDNLTLVTQVPRQHEGGIDYLEWWIEEHPNARLIIIDTLQKFRKLLSGKGSMYAEDYECISQIKSIADKFDIPILIIHHLKKAKENDDWLNEFSGSQGIAGSADTLFALKRQRTDNHAVLHRTGRDVEEKDFSMRIDRFGWCLEGDAELFTMPEWKRQILDYLKAHETISPMLLAQAVNITMNAARQNLFRLTKEGILDKVGHGTYKLKE